MQLSLLIAKILAVTYISAGIAALSGKITFRKMMEDFEKSQGLTFVSGFFTLVFGMLLVEYHNIWVQDWRVLITIVGWLSLIKGILFMACPWTLFRFKKNWYENTQTWGVVMLAFGLLFAYLGFMG